MTFDKMFEQLANEMEEECKKDEKKAAIVMEMQNLLVPALSGEKIDGLALFDFCHRFTEVFPDYTAAMLAMGLMARFGLENGQIEFDGKAPDFNADMNDVATGLDSLDGIEIDGEG